MTDQPRTDDPIRLDRHEHREDTAWCSRWRFLAALAGRGDALYGRKISEAIMHDIDGVQWSCCCGGLD
jgi:hypothetical protein